VLAAKLRFESGGRHSLKMGKSSLGGHYKAIRPAHYVWAQVRLGLCSVHINNMVRPNPLKLNVLIFNVVND